MRHVTDSPNTGKRLTPKHGFAMLVGLFSLTLPLQGSTNEGPPRLDTVLAQKTLTIVSVAGKTTHFAKDEFLYGFGYDLARAYAAKLQVKLKFKPVTSNKAALQAVKSGRADLALTTLTADKLANKGVSGIDLSCGNAALLTKHGLNKDINWAIKDAKDPLKADADAFICQERDLGVIDRMATFYDQSMLNTGGARTLVNLHLTNRLPQFSQAFKENARVNRLDWHLLAAMGYQESKLDASAVSPTGVTGLMMLTQQTAQGLGVKDRADPAQSIEGGAKYFRQLQLKYAQAPRSDRLWLALAAYNMGPGTLDRIRNTLKSKGKDPNNWGEIFQYLSTNSAKNGQYNQCIQYVTRIRTYLETIKQDRKLSQL
jgi:membrane-bound lytic murein transglycosylase MltF